MLSSTQIEKGCDVIYRKNIFIIESVFKCMLVALADQL